MSDWEILEIVPPDDDNQLVPDPKTAKHFDRTLRTFSNWDKSAKMAADGWPKPILINGRRYRRLGDLRRFEANLQANAREGK
jgi:hypothetical protein